MCVKMFTLAVGSNTIIVRLGVRVCICVCVRLGNLLVGAARAGQAKKGSIILFYLYSSFCFRQGPSACGGTVLAAPR